MPFSGASDLYLHYLLSPVCPNTKDKYGENFFISKVLLFLFLHEKIMKKYIYNFDPIKPLFYIVKGVYRGIHYFFLFLLKNIDCGYLLELRKKSELLSENFQFLVVKFSIYLNRCVFEIDMLPRQFH